MFKICRRGGRGRDGGSIPASRKIWGRRMGGEGLVIHYSLTAYRRMLIKESWHMFLDPSKGLG